MLLFGLFFTFGQVFGQNEVDPCEEDDTQMNLNLCAAKHYKEADAKLNATWKEVLGVLSRERITELRVAQKAWLTFRDAHCKFEEDAYEGGSIQPMIHFSCLQELTEQRTAQLQAILDDQH